MSANLFTILACNLLIFGAVCVLLAGCRNRSGTGQIAVILFPLLLCIIRIAVPVEFYFTQTLFIEVPFMVTKILHRSFDVCGLSLSLNGILITVWIAGCLVKTLLLFGRMYQFRKLNRRAMPYTAFDMKAALPQLKQIYPKADTVTLHQIPYGTAPCCSGLRHRRIYLPDSTYSDQELTCILRHEMAHFRNHDFLIAGLFEALRILQWWNPLVCWLYHHMQNIMEIKADKTALQGMSHTERANYAECLLKSARLTNARCAATQIAFIRSPQSLLTVRCRLVLSPEPSGRKFLPRPVAAALVCIGMVVLSLFVTVNTATKSSDIDLGPGIFSEDEVYCVRSGKGFNLYIQGMFMEYVETVSPEAAISIYDNLSEVPK